MRLGAGLLVEGFGETPMPGIAGSPPELPPLVERAGYAPARELFAYRIATKGLPRQVSSVADDARRGRGLVVRPIRPDRLSEELPRILEVLNDLPAHGRACSPWSAPELRWTVARLRPILDPGLVLVLELDGMAAGLALAVRNVREALGGRGQGEALLDAARVAAALRLRRVRSARIAVVAVRARFLEQGQSGLLALLLTELLGRLQLHGVQWAEISLVDPTDEPLVELLTRSGAQPYKTYRIFEKLLS
jgi:hypothetical protein